MKGMTGECMDDMLPNNDIATVGDDTEEENDLEDMKSDDFELDSEEIDDELTCVETQIKKNGK